LNEETGSDGGVFDDSSVGLDLAGSDDSSFLTGDDSFFGL